MIRGISIVTDRTWDFTFVELLVYAYDMKDMPSANNVWMSYLKDNGFKRFIIPNTCPACYTVDDFCKEHDTETYLLATGTHVIAVIDGDYYDTWDSGNEIPIYYFAKEE